MLAVVLSSAVVGLEGYLVDVEVDIANGIPGFSIVGLPDTACRESEDRVRAAIKNSGLPFPSRKITVNLAPADIKKEGSAYDLAIAIGILVASECIAGEKIRNRIFCGELSLDGRVRPVTGVLPRAASIYEKDPSKEFFVSSGNAKEALCIEGLKVYSVKTLLTLVQFLRGETELQPEKSRPAKQLTESIEPEYLDLDFEDIKGQKHAKRGLEIAAAGNHNVLMIGPPGSGKTMLAKRVPGILSSVSFDEKVEVTKIHSIAGQLLPRSGLIQSRPFRDPHHTISDAAMVGGGKCPKPGEISLAHRGVLFLDELAEFKRNVLEVLREPLEEGCITIARASSTLTFPARFMLVAAMNPCPCGHYTDPRKECQCTPLKIKNYLSRVSGPLLDRIDIQLEVPCLKSDEIVQKGTAESSEKIRRRVERARGIQRERYKRDRFRSNAELEAKRIARYCPVSEEGERLLKSAIEDLGFSARAYHKTIKVGRTIADLDDSELITAAHIGEAIHYRTLDKSLWCN